MKTFETLLLEKNNDVLTVWLKREEKGNSINMVMIKELIELTEYLRVESEINFVIFTNEGRFFSTGYDLNELYDISQGEKEVSKQFKLMQILGQEMIQKLENIEQVTIAALSGSAYGGGVAIAMAADFRLISNDSLLNLPETNIGMFLSWGCTPRLVKAVGATKAKELIMLCEDVTAEESLRLGLVNRIVSKEKMEDEVNRIVKTIRSKGQLSIRMTKKLANATVAGNIGDMNITEPELAEKMVLSGETKEMIMSFLERKKEKGNSLVE
ncbi:enoyl-CoA hydratase/carnithine racemase [Neobacillus niacini]|uniref:enoyl-CoA hydratase/isomerase family protein n=1 Tax=Neobacillus niacini TaxID=86668 RepID=UPI00285A8A80|nr:enoyl-CoA hydratase/isomerase family protein [Neobacillus niacini]MDR7079769.1 enoyl-CoA hydratase/carnithine racemase [Neobacillus niacini]